MAFYRGGPDLIPGQFVWD